MNLNRNEYEELRAELNFQREDKLGLFLLFLAADALLLILGFGLSTHGGPGSFISGQLLLALVFFHGYAQIHELGHGNGCTSRFGNLLLGHLASIFALVPFYSWKYLHASHHVWAGNEDRDADPTLRTICELIRAGINPKSIPHRVAKRVKIILLFSYRQLSIFWFYPLEAKEWRRPLFSTVLLVAIYVPLFIWLPDYINPKNLSLALPLYFALLFLVQVPFHLEAINDDGNSTCTRDERLPIWRHGEISRSIWYPAWIGRYYLLNMNLHLEHHLFPTLPWYRMEKVTSLLKTKWKDQLHQSKVFSFKLTSQKTTA